MSLRPYQQECLEAICQADAAGQRALLVVLPTGTGKTRVASSLPQAIGMGSWESMLFLVAQDELAFQAMEDLQACNPGLTVTLEKAQYVGDIGADIMVASVDTLARSPERLARVATTPFRLIFLDECHGAVSPKYLTVLKALRVMKDEPDRDPSRILIGLTATPRRFDGVGLSLIFDQIVYRRSIKEMIQARWIVEPVAYRVETGLDMDDVHMRQGDFATGELSRKMNTPETNALVVQKYLEYGAGLPAIAFTVDIKHSEDLAATFRHHGISFEAVSSNTPKDRRKELVRAHKNMEVTGLASCAALLTGFDSPPATVALFARPTCSGLLYTQALGRVLRPYPAPEVAHTHSGYVKSNAIVIDFVGASAKHRLYTASTLFGLHPDFNMAGRSCIKAAEEVEELARRNPTLDVAEYPGLDELKAAAVSVDLWKPAPIPKLAKTCSQFVWAKAGEDLYRLSAPGMAVYIRVNHLGEHEVYRSVDHSVDSQEKFHEPEDAFAYADSLVPEEAVKLIRANARWRKDEPSPNQCGLLWKMDPVIRKRFGNGEAFHRWACYQVSEKSNMAFSKGSLSLRIDMLKHAKKEQHA